MVSIQGWVRVKITVSMFLRLSSGRPEEGRGASEGEMSHTGLATGISTVDY